VAASQIVFDSGSDAPAEAATPQTSTWRVSQMGGVSGVSIVEAPLAHRSLQNALVGARLAREEAERVTRSLASVRNVDHLDQKDVLTLAIDSASLHVVAYELSSSPTEVWQGREQSLPDGTTKLEARRLDLLAQRVRVGKSVVVGPDLRASFAEAGLGSTEDLLSMLDDALDGHAELSDIRPGARLRLVATQDQVDGEFVRWVSLDAVEYFPASGNARPVRVYSLADSDSGREAAKRGFYDAKGRQPVRGGWRSPVPFARIASRFNPHRMHPVLHVIMPHNGVDFAAPNGAPVYATAAGTVTSVGNDGPCGNKVEIAHAAGISSVYCHLSRFVPGLRVGTRVEQRQLIAYVGQTGRAPKCGGTFGVVSEAGPRAKPPKCGGKFGVSEAGPRAKPPKCGGNSGFPKLGRGRNRPSAGKIRGFRSWAAGVTAQVRGKFGVSEAGPREEPPRCGENSGFPKLGRGGNRPGAGKIRGFRGWAAGGTAQVQLKVPKAIASPTDVIWVCPRAPPLTAGRSRSRYGARTCETSPRLRRAGRLLEAAPRL
jgi:murein DD-endopeptidase MepM/ murein hydrolase activator NlpD